MADGMALRLHLCGDSSQRPPLSLQGDHLPDRLLLGVMRTAEMPLRSAFIADPGHHDAQNIGRRVEAGRRRGTARPYDQDAARLIDAIDRRGRIVDR